MLILAGVSLNALVGDNGIITNAQNANVKSQLASLQEYIDQFYIEHYDEFESYPNNVLALKTIRSSSNWIYNGKFGYIPDEKGYIHYFLIIENFPKEIRDSMSIGKGPKEYKDYVEFNDVIGITQDLKVYYCQNGLNSINGVTLAELSVENGQETVFGSSSDYAKILKGAYSSENISKSDLRGVNSLIIDDKYNISNLNDIYNFINLTQLTIKNKENFDLTGIEYCPKIKEVFIQYSTIKDYKDLRYLIDLDKLFVEGSTNSEIERMCDDEIGIGKIDFSKLKYFGIYGFPCFSLSSLDSVTGYESGVHSPYSNLSYLSKLSDITKNSITNLFLNNNSIESLNGLYEFKNVTNLKLGCNYLTSLNDLIVYNNETKKYDGMTNLRILRVENNLLGKDIETTSLNTITDSLSILATSSQNDDGSYTFLANFPALSKVNLRYNGYLIWIIYLSDNSSLTELYFNNCPNLDLFAGVDSLMKTLANITYNADDYVMKYLSDNDKTQPVVVLDKDMTPIAFSNYMSGRENYLESLNLKGLVLVNDLGELIDNTSSPKLNDVISSGLSGMTKLQALSLNDISNLTSISFVTNLSDLRGIDLRGTSVTDLSPLLSSSFLHTLAIDNNDIVIAPKWEEGDEIPDITVMEQLINKIEKNSLCGDGGWTVSGRSVPTTKGHGSMLFSSGLISQLKYTTHLTNYVFRSSYDKDLPSYCSFDFSKNSGLKKVMISYISDQSFNTFIFGYDLDYLAIDQSPNTNISMAKDVDIDVLKFSNHSPNSCFSKALLFNNINTLYVYSGALGSFLDYYNYLSVDSDGTKKTDQTKNYLDTLGITDLTLASYAGGRYAEAVYNAFDFLRNFTGLETLKISYFMNCTNFDFLYSLTSLKSLTLYCTGLSTLGFLENLGHIEFLDVEYTMVSADSFNLDGDKLSTFDLIRNARNNGVFDTIYLFGTQITAEEIVSSGIKTWGWKKCYVGV